MTTASWIPWWSRSQSTAFAMALSRTAIAPAAARAVPLFALALMLGGGLLEAVELDRVLVEQRFALPALATAWVLALGHVRAPLLGGPATAYLRTFPVASPLLFAGVVAGVVVIDAPWIALCALTGEPAIVAAGAALTLAGHVAIASRRPASLALAAGLAGAAAIVPPWLIVVPALAVAVHATPWAWASARPIRPPRGRGLFVARPVVGLIRVLVTAVIRGDGPLLRRAALLLGAATAVAAIAVRNNELSSLDAVGRVVLVVLVLALPLVTTRITTGVLDTGWSLRWLCDTTGVGRRERVIAGVAVVVLAGGLAGAVHGFAVAMWTRPALAWQLAPIEALAGAVFGVLALGIAAAAVTRQGLEPIRLVAGVVALTIGAAFAVGADLRVAAIAGGVATIAAIAAYAARIDAERAPC